jgi:superfamily II RNA helicase
MTTELMFNAVWQDLDTPQLVALLSCLVECKEKDSADGECGVRIPLTLAKAVGVLQNVAGTICEVTNVRDISQRAVLWTHSPFSFQTVYDHTIIADYEFNSSCSCLSQKRLFAGMRD